MPILSRSLTLARPPERSKKNSSNRIAGGVGKTAGWRASGKSSEVILFAVVAAILIKYSSHGLQRTGQYPPTNHNNA